MKDNRFQKILLKYINSVLDGNEDDSILQDKPFTETQAELAIFYRFMCHEHIEFFSEKNRKNEIMVDITGMMLEAWLARADIAKDQVKFENRKLMCAFMGEYDDLMKAHKSEIHATADFLDNRDDLTDHQKATFLQDWISKKRVEWSKEKGHSPMP